MSGSRRGPSRGGGDGRTGGVDATRGADAARGPDAAQGPDRIEGTDAVAQVDAVRAAGPAGVEAIEGAGAARAASAADAVNQVAAALRAGSITVADAVDRLIEDALSRKVGRAIEQGSELEARLRRVLREYAGADPLISAKIRRLETRRGGR
jgi:hypothetical protein